jgi:hypothetical protein
MARTTEKKPTIADLLDQAAEGGTDLKLDKYLATLTPDVRDRVRVLPAREEARRLVGDGLPEDRAHDLRRPVDLVHDLGVSGRHVAGTVRE